jgi:hypothetical protein
MEKVNEYEKDMLEMWKMLDESSGNQFTINIYSMEDDETGEILFDKEEMRNEFELKMKMLGQMKLMSKEELGY